MIRFSLPPGKSKGSQALVSFATPPVMTRQQANQTPKAWIVRPAIARFLPIIQVITCLWITPRICAEVAIVDPHFGVADWQLSAHYQRNMSCTVCHDQHSAGMKTIKGADTSTNQDASYLCANCHKDAMQNFPTSTHAEAGVTCVNCHLGFNINGSETTSTASFDEIHKAPDHSFVATIKRLQPMPCGANACSW